MTVSAIARRTGLHRSTVAKYLARGIEPPAYGPRSPRPTKLTPFERYLRERIAAVPELTGSRLYREIASWDMPVWIHGPEGLPALGASTGRHRLRGPFRDARRPSGAGRFRPFPHGLHRECPENGGMTAREVRSVGSIAG
jgi:hypothetical protein